jgi:hypothetical protein
VGAIGAVPQIKERDEQSKGRLPRPAVRIQLWQQQGDEDAVVEDVDQCETVWESWTKDEDSPLTLIRSAGFWNASFTIPRNAIHRNANYRVIVEEGEVMSDVYDKNDNRMRFGLTRLISTLDVTGPLTSMR